MRIYTGMTTGNDQLEIHKRGMGMMLSSSPHGKPRAKMQTNKDLKVKGIPCALDNGAFPAFNKGYPFMEKYFLEALDAAYKHSIKLDFVVCPDIVCGGKESLEFSMAWAAKLAGCPNLALVVQDGMTIDDVKKYNLDKFTYIFIGGSKNWKWKTAERWVDFAHCHGMKCHIGQCGRLEYLKEAMAIGADSVDSTSFQRNKSWHIIDEFQGNYNKEQTKALFTMTRNTTELKVGFE